MVNVQQFAKLVKEAREKAKKRGFSQSFDLVVSLRDIDIKKQEMNINEVVYLPKKFSKKPLVCVFAGGDLALRAGRGGADRVIEPDELDKKSTDKRQLRKIANDYMFFLSETALMPKIGKTFGQFLGPRGKMPTPLPPNAPVEGLIARFVSAVRVRNRGGLAISCKIGDEGMSNEDLTENALSIYNVIEKKLPSGFNNVNKVMIKMSMGELVAISPVN
ncbi:MAG TPA: 50S ribosomal protein L1 [Nitrososphaerales archaeon]